MGGSVHNDDHYIQREEYRRATNTPTFAHTAAMASAPSHLQKAHDSLNPIVFGAAGKLLRESRDSAAHPESLAISVPFDVTASMDAVPRTVQKKFLNLMALLLKRGYVDHPQIMIGAVGDAYSDRAPIQVGQFESGIEIDNDLTNLWLERGGGGQKKESYGLFLYFMARHTSIDCWEKRQKKGYLFLIGDEMSHNVTPEEVKKYIGDTIPETLTVEQLLKEVQERYEVFFILPNMTSYWNDPLVSDYWQKLLPERFLRLEDPEMVCELIATTIGVMEGRADQAKVDDDLADMGVSSTARSAVSKALVTVAAGGTLATIPTSGAGTGLTTL